MPGKPSGAKPSVMRLKLGCVRVAQELLPHRAEAAEVMRLGRELYRWIGDDRPRPRRKLQRRLIKEAIGKFANPVNGTPYRTYAFVTGLIGEAATMVEQQRQSERQRVARPSRKLTAPIKSPKHPAPLAGSRRGLDAGKR